MAFLRNLNHLLHLTTLAALATALLLLATPARAGTTPLVTLVVPAAPGGSNDIVARVLEPQLRGELAGPVVVENRGGGGGNVGAAHVARAEAGSNVWLLTSASIITMNPSLFKNPGFDTLRDFAPVSGIATVPHVLLVHKDFAPSTLAELLTALREAPGKYFFGSAGNGTYSHILMEFLKRAEKVDASHVPFRGVAPAMTELMAGRIQMLVSTLPSAMPYLNRRDVKALALFSEQRSEFLPELPTARETVPGLVGDLWIALYAPAGTPARDIERMRQAVEKAKASSGLREKFRKMGASIYAPTVEELRQQTSADLSRWSQLIKQAGIQID
jgi:tripartite-type tricarboxylate transporter receptor subunit TctC